MFVATLLGRFGQDPELKTTKSGTEMCTATVATDSGFGDNKVTTWTKLVAFGKTAEFIAKFFHKGDSIFCTGEVVLEKWEDKDGNERQTLKLVVDKATFAGGSKKEESGARREEPRRERQESRSESRGGSGGF
jgi:single-strand DNA-binding protein